MQMCKCQQASIMYAHPSFKGGKEIHFGLDYFHYKAFNSKVSWFVERGCFPEKKIFGKWRYNGDHYPKGLEFQRKLSPRRWTEKEQAASLFVLSILPTRSPFLIDKPNNFIQ